MSNKETSVHISRSKIYKDIPQEQFQFCPKCGKECEQGFGMAGGGFGVYSYCEDHGIVGKIEIKE